MFKNLITRKSVAITLTVLVILNFLAFYFINQSIGITAALQKVEDPKAINSLQNKQIFSDIFPSIVFTIDIFIVLILLFLFIKFIFRSIKKSTPTK